MRTLNLLMNALMARSDGRAFPPSRQVALKAGVPIDGERLKGDRVHVIEKGIAGFLHFSAANGKISEVSMVGLEGIFPLEPFLDIPSRGQHKIVPQLGNLHVNVIDGQDFRDWLKGNEEVTPLLLRYLYFQLAEKNATIACLNHMRIEERIARYLLMCHDRSFGDSIRITHENLAQMTAAFRPTVTNALQKLAGDGLLVLGRGEIELCDRPGLRHLSGDAYGGPEQFYSDHIAPFGKSSASAAGCPKAA